MENRESMIEKISILDFMLLDLGLYLNVNPKDSKALELYSLISIDLEKIKKEFENNYEPLSSRNSKNIDDNWKWIDNPWPWELNNDKLGGI